MTVDLEKEKNTPSAMILLAVAVLLGALALYVVAGFFMATAQAELAVARAADTGATEPNDVEARLAPAKSAAEALKKNNLFAPPAPKQNPVREVTGILGSEALINGKWYEAGASVGDAKVVSVEPTKVKISWNGQEKEFSPIGAGGGGGPGGPPGPRPPRGPRGAPSGPPRGARAGRRPGRSGGPPGFSPDEQAKFREQYRNASPEERQKLREQMRERFGRPG